jgi:hypothetical protein
MIKNSILLVSLFLFISSFLNGQYYDPSIEEPSKKINFFEVAYSYAQPMKGFKERYGKNLNGIEANYLRQLTPLQPLFAYSKINYFSMGSFEFKNFNNETDRTAAHFIGLEVGTRYYLPIKLLALEFYGEIGLGGNNLYTVYSLTQEDESILSYKILGDSSLKYSTGLGMNVKAGFGYVFVKSSLQNGISTRYMVKKETIPNSIKTSDNAFEQTKSSLDVIKWDIGYTFVF